MRERPSFDGISDDDLLLRLSELLGQSRGVEADLVAHIAEVDERRLYAREAAHSMFAWCTEVLHLSEHEAYLRITVARASRQHPVLLEMLRDGRLHLSGICKLVPHLTGDNCEGLLRRAEHKSKRQIEELVASIAPRPSLAAAVRKLPDRQDMGSFGSGRATSPGSVGAGQAGVEPTAVGFLPPDCARSNERSDERSRSGEHGSDDAVLCPSGLGPDRVPEPFALRPTQAAVVEPIASARFRVRFDANAELRDKLERLQALMRASVPDGDLGKIIDQAVWSDSKRAGSRRRKHRGRPSRKPTRGRSRAPSRRR